MVVGSGDPFSHEQTYPAAGAIRPRCDSRCQDDYLGSMCEVSKCPGSLGLVSLMS